MARSWCAEDPLEREQVAAVAQERDGERVAAGVGRHAHAAEAGAGRRPAHARVDGADRLRPARALQEQGIAVGAAGTGSGPVEVAAQRGFEGPSDRHDPFVAALPLHPQESVEDVAAGQPDRLADTQPGVEQDPQGDRQGWGSRGQHRPDLVVAEGGDDRPGHGRPAQARQRIDREVRLLDAPVAEDLEGTDAVGHGRRPATLGQSDRPGPAGVEVEVGQDLPIGPGLERGAVAGDPLEVAGDRPRRQAACPAIGDKGVDDLAQAPAAGGLTHPDTKSGAHPRGANQVIGDLPYQVTKPRVVPPAGGPVTLEIGTRAQGVVVWIGYATTRW